MEVTNAQLLELPFMMAMIFWEMTKFILVIVGVLSAMVVLVLIIGCVIKKIIEKLKTRYDRV